MTMLDYPEMMNGRGQTCRLYRALLQGEVNPLTSWRSLGIYRLAARVLDLKRLGVPVRSRWIYVKNQYQEECRVKEYYIEEVQ